MTSTPPVPATRENWLMVLLAEFGTYSAWPFTPSTPGYALFCTATLGDDFAVSAQLTPMVYCSTTPGLAQVFT